MARITVEDCLPILPNRFRLILAAAWRADQLSKGAPSEIDAGHDKCTVQALREIAAGKIDLGKVFSSASSSNRDAFSQAAFDLSDEIKTMYNAKSAADTEEIILSTMHTEFDELDESSSEIDQGASEQEE